MFTLFGPSEVYQMNVHPDLSSYELPAKVVDVLKKVFDRVDLNDERSIENAVNALVEKIKKQPTLLDHPVFLEFINKKPLYLRILHLALNKVDDSVRVKLVDHNTLKKLKKCEIEYALQKLIPELIKLSQFTQAVQVFNSLFELDPKFLNHTQTQKMVRENIQAYASLCEGDEDLIDKFPKKLKMELRALIPQYYDADDADDTDVELLYPRSANARSEYDDYTSFRNHDFAQFMSMGSSVPLFAPPRFAPTAPALAHDSGSTFFNTLASLDDEFSYNGTQCELDLVNGELVIVPFNESSLSSHSLFVSRKTKLRKIQAIAKAVTKLAAESEKKIRDKNGKDLDVAEVKKSLAFARTILMARAYEIKESSFRAEIANLFKEKKPPVVIALGAVEPQNIPGKYSNKLTRLAEETAKVVNEAFIQTNKHVTNFKNPVYVDMALAALTALPKAARRLFNPLSRGGVILQDLQRRRESLNVIVGSKVETEKKALDLVLEASLRNAEELEKAANSILRDHYERNLGGDVPSELKKTSLIQDKIKKLNNIKAEGDFPKELEVAIRALELAQLAGATDKPKEYEYSSEDLSTWKGYSSHLLKQAGQVVGRPLAKCVVLFPEVIGYGLYSGTIQEALGDAPYAKMALAVLYAASIPLRLKINQMI